MLVCKPCPKLALNPDSRRFARTVPVNEKIARCTLSDITMKRSLPLATLPCTSHKEVRSLSEGFELRQHRLLEELLIVAWLDGHGHLVHAPEGFGEAVFVFRGDEKVSQLMG